MNPGDVIKIDMYDTPNGYRTVVTDRTTHRVGFMTASVANGFRHILFDPQNLTCNGAPYAFHAMYNTASIPGCLGSDSDFDGFPYHPDWPNGSAAFPSPNLISSPRVLNSAGAVTGTYPVARFETDLPRIEEANNGGGLSCDHHTGQGCTNPPPGAFYPWFHLMRVQHKLAGQRCAWGLTNDTPGQISNFGGEQAAWGPLELTNYGFDLRYHNFAHVIPNPCP